MPVQTRIQLRQDTAANWTSVNPTLAVGEGGYETDTGKIKYGDGATAWTSLPYHFSPYASSTNTAGKLALRDANGVTALSGLQLDTAATPTQGVGKIIWDATYGTPQVGLLGGNVNLQIGQEQVVYARNGESTTLLDGEVVYLFGAQGDRPVVKRASNTGDSTSATIIGMVTEPIAAGQVGFITNFGTVNGLDMSAYNTGDILWLGSTPGTYTATKPVAPAHTVFVGVVQKNNSGNGGVFVMPQNGYELDELHDVLISGKANLDVLSYESSTGLWKNKTLASAGIAAATHSHAISDVTGLQTALDAKAPLASPSLTGIPTAPTATAGTNTTQIATTAFVSTAVANVIDSAPGALDTLNELAAALGDDANFATTVTNSLATKAPLASPALTGVPTAPTAAVDTDTTQLATTAYVVGQGYLKSATAASTYSAIGHSHAISDVTGLQTALDGKAASSHTHTAAQVTPGTADKSASYTLVSGDAQTIIRSTNSAITITVPDVLANGQRIDFIQAGTGQVTFAGSGVTINAVDNKLKTNKQYSGATIMKVGGAYYLVGDLAA